MFARLLQTRDDLSYFIIRITVGLVILPHGLQKLIGAFGGGGIVMTIDSFEKWFGLPPIVTFLVILAESFGALLLIFGLLTRFMAASIGLVMIGAIIFVVGKWGFFMNWYSQQRGEGFEFHLLVIGMVIMLIISGGGKWSLDQILLTKIKPKTNN